MLENLKDHHAHPIVQGANRSSKIAIISSCVHVSPPLVCLFSLSPFLHLFLVCNRYGQQRRSRILGTRSGAAREGGRDREGVRGRNIILPGLPPQTDFALVFPGFTRRCPGPSLAPCVASILFLSCSLAQQFVSRVVGHIKLQAEGFILWPKQSIDRGRYEIHIRYRCLQLLSIGAIT